MIFHCTSVPHLFNHSSVDGHSGCFHVLAVVKVLQRTMECMYLLKWSFSLEFMPRSGTAGSYGSFLFFFCLFTYLAVLGLYCCVRAFSSCSEQELLCSCSAQASHRNVLSCCGVWASLVVALRPSCPTAYEFFPDQGSNLCPLWEVDSQPLDH